MSRTVMLVMTRLKPLFFFSRRRASFPVETRVKPGVWCKFRSRYSLRIRSLSLPSSERVKESYRLETRRMLLTRLAIRVPATFGRSGTRTGCGRSFPWSVIRLFSSPSRISSYPGPVRACFDPLPAVLASTDAPIRVGYAAPVEGYVRPGPARSDPFSLAHEGPIGVKREKRAAGSAPASSCCPAFEPGGSPPCGVSFRRIRRFPYPASNRRPSGTLRCWRRPRSCPSGRTVRRW